VSDSYLINGHTPDIIAMMIVEKRQVAVK